MSCYIFVTEAAVRVWPELAELLAKALPNQLETCAFNVSLTWPPTSTAVSSTGETETTPPSAVRLPLPLPSSSSSTLPPPTSSPTSSSTPPTTTLPTTTTTTTTTTPTTTTTTTPSTTNTPPVGPEWVVCPAKVVTAEFLTAVRPQRVLIAHAGLPPSLAKAVEDASLSLQGEGEGEGAVPVPVYNVHHNSAATGETAIMLLLALQRRLLIADPGCRRGDWSFRQTATVPSAHCRASGYKSTAIIIGYGAVGKHIAGVLQALGTTVIAIRRTPARAPSQHTNHNENTCDPTPGDVTSSSKEIEIHPPSALASLLPRATALIIAAPLTTQTRGLIGEAELAKLPKGASVINVGRAEIIDEDAMWAEVESNRLGFAADVWWAEATMTSWVPEGEFFGSRHPFHTRDNVVMTPHYGGGVGLDGIEEARIAAIIDILVGVEAKTCCPCDLSQGY